MEKGLVALDAPSHIKFSFNLGPPSQSHSAPLVGMRKQKLDLFNQQAHWNRKREQKTIDTIGDGEISCPASDEAGKRTTCERCGLCAGASRAAKDITIIAHGTGAGSFDR